MSSSPGPDVGSALGPQQETPREAEPPARNQALGIAAIVSMGLAIAALPVGSLLANLPPFGGDAVVVLNVIFTVAAFFTVAALVLGIVAIVTKRGATWGLAAVIVSGLLVLGALGLFAMPLLLGGGGY